MNRESTLRAIEGMSLPGPRKTTPRAVLGSVPRIDFGNYALSLEKCLSEKDYSRVGDKYRRSPSILCPECAVEAQSNCS